MKKTNFSDLGSVEEKNQLKEINTRFGKISFNKTKQLFFYSGLLGFPGAMSFCLAELPDREKVAFKIFQNIDQEDLSFIVLPLLEDEHGNYAIIDKKDIDNVSAELEIAKENLVILLICTFHKEGDKTRIFVNAKAPLFIDSEKLAGLQYVFNDEKYEIKHEITK